MEISATYICPVRGLTSFEPPEPERLGQAAKVAKSLGLNQLMIPVFEAALAGQPKRKVQYLDGIIRALDQVADAGLGAWLIAPAQKILGLDWACPSVVSPVRDPNATPVYIDGRVRHVRAYNWWPDPSLIQHRIELFRETLTAVHGHPAIKGWVALDRALEWARPDSEVAELVLRSYLGEILEREEKAIVYLGIGWQELIYPETMKLLAPQVDGLRMAGLEIQSPNIEKPEDPADEIRLAAYLGDLAQWLFERPTTVETGWGLREDAEEDPEETIEAGKRMAEQGLAGMSWVSLIDPEPHLKIEPPWSLWSGLERVGLLDYSCEPKEWVEAFIEGISSSEPIEKAEDFIDIGRDEYLEEPQVHLSRLWDHFRE